jgi:tetratricopeptide (TPR) repeat protein
LAYAQQHLNSAEPKLEKAIAIYKEVLNDKPDGHNHLDRANRIRIALKLHSKRLVEQESPTWAEAHKALAFLPDLGLNSDEVITWRQDLILEEVKAWLKHNDLDAAFVCLDTLDTVQHPWPLIAIQVILHQYSQQYAKSGAWQIAIEILERFGNKIREDVPTRQWVYLELTKLGNILRHENNLEGADKAFETALRFR